jgi:mannose-6-phosphate isomerase-like protein (cupin superfamily)
MNIFLDIDNTICNIDEKTHGAEKYVRAVPIVAHIHRANRLYDEGNRITYWTARGKASGVDYSDLTRKQLTEWGCKYHELRFDKPSYDLYVDDKSQNTMVYFDSPSGCDCSSCRITTGCKVEKGWGYERVIANSEKYCGKVLHFNRGARFSMHYHIKKTETWYVSSGQFEFRWIDTRTADMNTRILNIGDIVTNQVGQPHQLVCLAEGDIFEVSTQHFDSDSYRVMKGDSQESSSSSTSNHNVVLLMHMGLGDHIMMTPAVCEVAKRTKKVYIPCKTMYVETLKHIYGEINNLELIPIISTSDVHVIGSEIQRVLGELGELHKSGEILVVAPTGMYNKNPNPPYPFPTGFYKDLGLDFMTCRKGFAWACKPAASQPLLLTILKQLSIGHVFVHDTSSTTKGESISIDVFASIDKTKTIALNPDRNMYESTHPFYYLAQLAVRTPTQYQNILEYIPIMETAQSLYLIDSCYFSMSAFIDLSKVRMKKLYKRADVNYEWLRDDPAWIETLL